jgi:hypothetical protein
MCPFIDQIALLFPPKTKQRKEKKKNKAKGKIL